MRTILVLNSKGGCGKSTLVTNLAAWYALHGYKTAIADHDPQASSLEWLKVRPKDRPAIEGLDGTTKGLKPASHTDVLIHDAPAGIHGAELTALVKRAQTILIPVLPSATDIRATAHFIHDLLLVGKVERKETRLATIANRVPEIGARDRMLNTVGYETLSVRLYRPLQNFLERLRIPFITTLPDSPAYALADQRGLSIFEVNEDQAALDRAAWNPLLLWLDSRQSLPRKS
jgi:chromosome partitioning protein